MKKNIRSKISGFLTSEEGRVSTKAPLALGVATGGVLLAQMMHPSPVQAEPILELDCFNNADCTAVPGQVCAFWEVPGPTLIIRSACIFPPDN